MIKLLLLILLTTLTISSVYAQVGSTGLTRSMPVDKMSNDALSEEEIAQDRGFLNWNSCSFNYSTLSEEEIEEIKNLEKEVIELSQEINSIRKNAQGELNNLYESIVSQNNGEEDDLQKWEEYSKKYEELENKLGITQRNKRINVIQEELQEYFNGCYNSYDEEWILFKLGDEEKKRYNDLQEKLKNSHDEESKLYDENSIKYSRIYEESREKSLQLEKEIGVTQIQEQIRELQSQINTLRDEYRDEFDSISNNQKILIENLEIESGIRELREERESINEEIQELTGNQGYGTPIMYARGMETPTPMNEFDNKNTFNENEAVVTNVGVDTTSQSSNLQEICENNAGNWLEEFYECEFNNKTICEEQMGGEFNECGSACRNNPDSQICTLQCVPYCDVSNSTLREDTLDVGNETNNESINESERNSSDSFIQRIRSFFSSIFSN